MGSCPDTDIDPDFFPLLLHLFTDFYDSFTELVFIFCVLAIVMYSFWPFPEKLARARQKLIPLRMHDL